MIESETSTSTSTERPIGRARGTRDWPPDDFQALAARERTLIDQFTRAGFSPMRTPILEVVELHERKSGAAIVSKLFELREVGPVGLCLRPELTAGVVRAYAEAVDPGPWRVCVAGPVFRFEAAPGGDRLREFTQVGVEWLGATGPEADAEIIRLAAESLRAQGVADARVRVGHVGLILELLRHSGLPTAATAALIEVLSEAAGEGHNVQALEAALDRLAAWLRLDSPPDATLPADDQGVDRLFRHLVPNIVGRRGGKEITERLRCKWDLGHTLNDVLDRVQGQLHALAGLRGPALPVLERLKREFGALAPDSVAWLDDLVDRLRPLGLDHVELDLGFGRGIGFYSQMIFELIVPTPDGDVEVCGGGRYDGLARVLGSPRDDPGAGFAFGLERLCSVLDRRAANPQKD